MPIKKIDHIIEDIFIYFFIVVTPLIYTTATPDNQIAIKLFSYAAALLLFSLFILFKSKREEIRMHRNSLFFFSVVITYAALSGIGLIYTINITDGLLSFSKILILACSIILFYINFNDPILLITKITKAFTFLGLVIIIIGIYQLQKLFISESISHGNLYKITAVFGHKNIYAQVLLLCLPFSAYIITFKKNVWRLIGIFNSTSILVILTILMTRSVWISSLFSLVIVSIIALLNSKSFSFNLKNTAIVTIVIILIISVSIGLYSRFDQSSAFLKQATKIVNFNYGSTKDRLILWEKSIKLGNEKPLFGHGLGSWKINILKYGNQNLKSEDNLTFYQRPHNDYIWLYCEQGIISLALYLLIFLITIYTSIKLLKRNLSNDIKLFILLMIYALICYLVFSFFSFPLDRIEFIIFISMIISILLLLDKTENKRKSIIKLNTKLFLTIITSLLVVTSVFGLTRINSEIHLKKAYEARSKNNWKALVSEIDKSISPIYEIDPFSTPLIWYRGVANFNKGNIEIAEIDFQKAYEINPYHIHVLNNLATCKGIDGKYNEAIELYKKALDIAPNFEDAIYNICSVYLKINKLDSAINCLKKVKNPVNINRHNKIIVILITQKLYALIKLTKDEKINNYINSILQNNAEILALFSDSVNNNNSIENQVMLNYHNKSL